MVAYSNPFLGRTSERKTSDQEFVQLFSPKILERIPEEALKGHVHIFSSPPGGGKTTLLRALTPSSLRAFWNAKKSDDFSESYQVLSAKNVIDKDGPRLLGVYLSCAAGYADLPAGLGSESDGLFRALLDCRVVLRAVRSLAAFLGRTEADRLEDIEIRYLGAAQELSVIPKESRPAELIKWAESRERAVYSELDSVASPTNLAGISSVRFEGVIWLQGVKFFLGNDEIAPQRLLMIDDVQRLKRSQRQTLLSELVEMRPQMPVWLAERTIAIGSDLISQGARERRDVTRHGLDDLWQSSKSQQQFQLFVLNIIDRRIKSQDILPPSSFHTYIGQDMQKEKVAGLLKVAVEKIQEKIERFRKQPRYSEWIDRVDSLAGELTLDALREIYIASILMCREEKNRQLAFDLPLSAEELEEKSGSDLKGAAEIFLHADAGVPYYYGFERLCTMATYNVEEVLSLVASLYDALVAKQIINRGEITLSPVEQEKAIKEVARRKREFIPRSHTQGTRAKLLIDGVGRFCRERTFEPNAPYAPGVTGVRLSKRELEKIFGDEKKAPAELSILKAVISECVAENLLTAKESSASTSRDSGTIFYLNRTLCAHFSLPLQMGGWKDVKVEEMIEWMSSGRPSKKALDL